MDRTIKHAERKGGYQVICVVADIEALGALILTARAFDGSLVIPAVAVPRKGGGVQVTFKFHDIHNAKCFHDTCQALSAATETPST